MSYVYNPFINNFDEVGVSSAADVIGPGSATDNALVRWDGTSGEMIKNSVAILDDSGNLTTNSISLTVNLAVSDGGTGASTEAGARTNLGLEIGVDVQAWDAGLDDIAALAVTDGNFIVGDGANWTVETGLQARTSLGLGSISTQDSSSVTITGGSITGITDLAVADGGTGSSTSAGARINLGLVIGTDVQAHDAGLDDISGLAVTDGNIIVGDGLNWVAESGATARTSLGVSIGTDVQAWDAGLDDISGLAVTDGNFIVGDGGNWVAESGATARTSLGLGSIATQESNNVTITGGSITGITDIVVADGGTGASSFTAYAVVCGGTTSTGALQSIAGVGTSGQVLTSNGSAALPTFQDAGGGGGIMLQQQRSSTSTYTALSTSIPFDNTIPQQTEGDEIMTVSITPADAANILVVEATVTGALGSDSSGEDGLTAALFRDTTAGAVAAVIVACNTASDTGEEYCGGTAILKYSVAAGATDATTFKIRCGSNDGDGHINGDADGAKYGGVSVSTIYVSEFSS